MAAGSKFSDWWSEGSRVKVLKNIEIAEMQGSIPFQRAITGCDRFSSFF